MPDLPAWRSHAARFWYPTLVAGIIGALGGWLLLTELGRIPRANIDGPWILARAYYVATEGVPREPFFYVDRFWLLFGHPYALGIWLWLTDTSLYFGRLFSVLSGAGLLAATFLIARRLHSALAGTIAVLLLMVDSHFLGTARRIRPDMWAVFLAFGGLLAFLYAVDKKNAWLAALAGVLCGLAMISHPNTLWAPLVALGWYLVYIRQRFFLNPVGWAYAAGIVAVLAVQTGLLALDWELFLQQYDHFSEPGSKRRVPSFDLAVLLSNLMSEPSKYAKWYYGLITNETPNALLLVFQTLTAISYVLLISSAFTAYRKETAWRLLFILALAPPLIMALVVVNKSHTYMIYVLPSFAILCGVVIGEFVERSNILSFFRRRRSFTVLQLSSLALVAAWTVLAIDLYQGWFQKLKDGGLETYVEFSDTLLAAFPSHEATVVVNPVFLMPHRRSDLDWVASSGILYALGFADPEPTEETPFRTLRPEEPKGSVFVLHDRNSFPVESIDPETDGGKWALSVNKYLSEHCVIRSHILTTNREELRLFECSRFAEASPEARPANIAVAGKLYTKGETVWTASARDLAEWRAYRSDQEIAVTEESVVITGELGAGLWRTLIIEELGLEIGDPMLIEANLARTSSGAKLALHGGIVSQPHLIETDDTRSGWHGLTSAPVEGPGQYVVAKGLGPEFRLYVYSEAPVEIEIRSLSIHRLNPAEKASDDVEVSSKPGGPGD